MSVSVADRSSNKNEQIVNAAEALGRSKYRRQVFKQIYTGKSKVKTVLELMKATKFIRTRVLDAGRALADNGLVRQIKSEGVTAYEKIDFFQRFRDKVLAADSPAKQAKIPTKRNPVSSKKSVTIVTTTLRIPKSRNRAKRVTIDDIDSFKSVRKIPHGLEHVRMPEAKFKKGIAAILGERDAPKDWGGERSDLSSSHLRINGKRHSTAFAFKGPGTTGKLTPGKMGVNGDQIQRLSACPADVFFVQYWTGVDDSVAEQLEKLIQQRSYYEDREMLHGVIDGDDSARLIAAYPKQFGQSKSAKKVGGKKR